MTDLWTPIKVGNVQLPHRLTIAPMRGFLRNLQSLLGHQTIPTHRSAGTNLESELDDRPLPGGRHPAAEEDFGGGDICSPERGPPTDDDEPLD